MRSLSPILYLALLMPVAAAPSNAFAQPLELKPEHCLGGAPDAPIRIEVFSDFECPVCREFYLNTIQPVLKDYSGQDKVCVIYYEFPLEGHKYSGRAAQYSKAAQRLGQKQWQAVMEALYESQEKWSRDGSVDDVVRNALGADEYLRLKELLLDRSIEREIRRDIDLGQNREVRVTPTLFVHALGREQKVEGALPYRVLKDFIDSIVK